MSRRVDVVVDLSNVCRDRSLGTDRDAELARFDQLVEACRRQMGQDVSILAVADESLLHRLDKEDRRRLKSMEQEGSVLIAPKADLPILRIADDHGAVVISRDNFKDHRKEFPWIAEASGRFWDWESDTNQIALRERRMTRYPSFELSRAADRDDLRGQFHLDDERLREVLSFRWSCTNSGCLSHRFPEDKRPLPTWDGGRYICSACGSPAQRGESRPRAIELKIGNESGEVLRPVLEEGAVIRIGRETSDIDVASFVAGSIRKISAHHADFEFDGAAWFVTDRGSTNGTWVAEWDREQDARADWVRLDPHVRTRLSERCRVSIADVIRVDRSGKLSVRS